VRVRFSLEAEAQLAVRRKWWRENREKAPDLFDRELDEAIDRLGRGAGTLPIFTTRGGRTIRRYLMRRTRCHLYLEVVQESDEVLVLGAGGSQRRRPPRLRLNDAP
jgi:hypothetical protein